MVNIIGACEIFVFSSIFSSRKINKSEMNTPISHSQYHHFYWKTSVKQRIYYSIDDYFAFFLSSHQNEIKHLIYYWIDFGIWKMTDWITWMATYLFVCESLCVCMVLKLDFLQLFRWEKITDVENLRKQHIDHPVGEQEWTLQKTTDTTKPNHRAQIQSQSRRYTQHNIRLAFNLSHCQKPKTLWWIETRRTTTTKMISKLS